MRAPDLSSGIVRSLDALTDLLLLNLLWLLTGASIVTLGASTAAVYGALRALEREEDGGVVRNFFRCWRRSWRQAGFCGLLQMSLTGLLLRNFISLRGQPNPVAVALAWLSLAALIILSGIFALIYPMAARERRRFADYLRDAALLFRMNIGRVLLQPTLLALPLALALFWTELFLRTLPFWVLFGFSGLFRLFHALQRAILDPPEPESQ